MKTVINKNGGHFIVSARQSGGVYHGTPHKTEAVKSVAAFGFNSPIESATMAALESVINPAPYVESGASYAPTPEAFELAALARAEIARRSATNT